VQQRERNCWRKENWHTEQKIQNFKVKLETGGKTDETLTLDSAVWYIEAALNYSYSDSYATEIIKVDSAFVSVPVSDNGTINFNHVVYAYNKLYGGLINIYTQTEGENLSIRLTDISLKAADNKSDEQTFKLTAVITKGVPTYSTFGVTDYWYPMFEKGKCDAYAGLCIGYDATSQLEQKANYDLRFARGYLTDIEYRYAGDGSYMDYLWQGGENECLSPSELNGLLANMKDLANILKPINKDIINYSVDYSIILGKQSFGSHTVDITYGIWHEIILN